MRISDWSSDVCSSDLEALALPRKQIAPRDHSFVARKDHAIAVPARKNGDEPLLYGAWAGLATARSPPPGCCEFTTGAAQSYHERSIYGGTPPPCLVARPCRSEEHTTELQSPMRKSYAVFSLK